MLGTFILGIVAGWGAPRAEPKIKDMLQGILAGDAPLTPVEMRGISVALCLLAAAVLAGVFGEPHVVPLALGGVLGVFGPRLKEKWKASRAPDYDS